MWYIKYYISIKTLSKICLCKFIYWISIIYKFLPDIKTMYLLNWLWNLFPVNSALNQFINGMYTFMLTYLMQLQLNVKLMLYNTGHRSMSTYHIVPVPTSTLEIPRRRHSAASPNKLPTNRPRPETESNSWPHFADSVPAEWLR